MTDCDGRRDHGALVISLDFELYWGVSDLCWPPSYYDQNVLGARAVVPRLLNLFEENRIAATWAVVGMLFADSKAEAETYYPKLLPHYQDRRLSPYYRPPADRKYCYAPELIERIASTPCQELGVHTFSHYYCLEPGQTLDEFEADVVAAINIAKDHGAFPESIALPRNQVRDEHLRVLARNGISVYRGTQRGWLHQAGSRRKQRVVVRRAGRLAEAWFRSSCNFSYDWSEINRTDGLSNVRASRYLRPSTSRPRWLQAKHIQNIRRDIREAAQAGRVYHLWWHPEDMGSAVDAALHDVASIFEEFQSCRARYGMESLSMSGAAAVARGVVRQPAEPEPVLLRSRQTAAG